MALMKPLLIDDFRGDTSALGTSWQLFTDRVMGGQSDARASRTRIAGTPCLVIDGTVRIEGNGGFLQVALPLAQPGKSFDASAWTSIRLQVARGDGQWALHLRTDAMTAPWMHYRAVLPGKSDRSWVTVDVPFSSFRGERTDTPLDLARLTRVGIVAVAPAGLAQLAIARVELV
jgi:hypothetical protein